MKQKLFACRRCRSHVLPESAEAAACSAGGTKYRVDFKRLSVIAALPLVYVFSVAAFRTWQMLLGGLLMGVGVAYVLDRKGWKWGIQRHDSR